MKIAVLSDIHENFNNLLRALDMIRELGAEKILCLGDFMNPGIAKELARCGIPVFSIWGNNDGDQVTITKIALQEGSGLEIGDKTYAVIELDSRQIFMTHYPDLVKPAALSGMFDVVFYGHDHLKSEAQIGDCLIINPGELSAHKTKSATFAMYDSDANRAEFHNVQKSVSTRTEFVDQYFAYKAAD